MVLVRGLGDIRRMEDMTVNSFNSITPNPAKRETLI
jgi:hypothetical protein